MTINNIIEPYTLLQVDASVIVGVFIFLTILEYRGHNRKPDPVRETQKKKQKLLFPSIIVIFFATSAIFTLIPTAYFLSIPIILASIFTGLGFAFIIVMFFYWRINPDNIPY